MRICTPLRFVSDSPRHRGRIGGRGPVGVAPRFRDAETSYFATIPISADLDASIFLSTSDIGPRRTAWSLAHRIHGAECLFVEAVVHQPARRSKRSPFGVLVSAASMQEQDSRPDMDPHWDGCPFMDHKLGGVPGLPPASQHWGKPIQQLFEEGYALALQLTFPSSDDTLIKGSWPFGEFTFLTFHRVTGDDHDFKFLWTQ
jgi:hypothetical protein